MLICMFASSSCQGDDSGSFKKHLLPILSRVRVLNLDVHDTREKVLDIVSRTRLPRLRILLLVSNMSVPFRFEVLGLHHHNVNTVDEEESYNPTDPFSPPETTDEEEMLRSHYKFLNLMSLRLQFTGFDTAASEGFQLFLPSLTDFFLSSSIPGIIRCMEMLKMPNIQLLKMDTQSLSCLTERDLDDNPDAMSCFSNGRYSFLALKVLSICSQAEAIPYFTSRFSANHLDNVERLLLKRPSSSVTSESPLFVPRYRL